MNSRTVLLLATLAPLALGTPAGAQPFAPPAPPPSPGLPPPMRAHPDEAGILLGLLLRGAGLTPEQRTRVQNVVAAHQRRIDAARREVRRSQDELADRMAAPGPLALPDVEPVLDRLARAHGARVQAIAAAALEARAVLTPEQLARAATWKDRVRHLRDEWQELFDDEDAAGPPRTP